MAPPDDFPKGALIAASVPARRLHESSADLRTLPCIYRVRRFRRANPVQQLTSCREFPERWQVSTRSRAASCASAACSDGCPAARPRCAGRRCENPRVAARVRMRRRSSSAHVEARLDAGRARVRCGFRPAPRRAARARTARCPPTGWRPPGSPPARARCRPPWAKSAMLSSATPQRAAQAPTLLVQEGWRRAEGYPPCARAAAAARA